MGLGFELSELGFDFSKVGFEFSGIAFVIYPSVKLISSTFPQRRRVADVKCIGIVAKGLALLVGSRAGLELDQLEEEKREEQPFKWQKHRPSCRRCRTN